LVFPNGAGNPENHGNLLRRGFHPALRRAGLRQIRFHDLRHCFASLLIHNGEEPKKIQRIMGHASITTTYNIYGHLLPDATDGIANRLSDLVFGSKTVATQKDDDQEDTQLIELMVARDRIELPTRGFSVPCSTD